MKKSGPASRRLRPIHYCQQTRFPRQGIRSESVFTHSLRMLNSGPVTRPARRQDLSLCRVRGLTAPDLVRTPRWLENCAARNATAALPAIASLSRWSLTAPRALCTGLAHLPNFLESTMDASASLRYAGRPCRGLRIAEHGGVNFGRYCGVIQQHHVEEVSRTISVV